MAKKLPALGKGFTGKGVGALIQTKDTNSVNQEPAKSASNKRSSVYEVVDIEINKIAVNPLQPRKEFDKIKLNELKDSILKYGLMNPITVKENIGGYEIVAGERRFRAFQLAGLDNIPAIITSITSNVEQLEKALIENIQREDLNPIEIANSYQQLIEEFDYTQEQLADRVGKERSTVANFIRLLKLPASVQDLVLTKKITMGHARALLSLEDPSQMISVANDVITKELSVRATEQFVRNVLSEKVLLSKDGKRKVQSPKYQQISSEEKIIIEQLQNRLRTIYGTNIHIFTKADNKGTIEFEFYSNDDFMRIVELLERE